VVVKVTPLVGRARGDQPDAAEDDAAAPSTPDEWSTEANQRLLSWGATNSNQWHKLEEQQKGIIPLMLLFCFVSFVSFPFFLFSFFFLSFSLFFFFLFPFSLFPLFPLFAFLSSVSLYFCYLNLHQYPTIQLVCETYLLHLQGHLQYLGFR